MKRPKIITVFCVLMYVGLLISFPQVFSPGVKKLGVFVPAIYGLLVAAQFIATVGIGNRSICGSFENHVHSRQRGTVF